MGWFGRRRDDTTPGYEDNAALRGFGGYEPADAPRFPSSAGFEASPQEEPQRAVPRRIRPAPKRRRSSRLPWIGLALIALIAGVLNAFGVGRSHKPPAPRTPVVSTPSPRFVAPAAVAGWQSVVGRDGTFAYDVPPNWTPAPTTLHGWEKTSAVPGISLITSAFLDSGFCPGRSASKRGGSGLTTENSGDPETAARQAVSDLGVSRYSPDEGPLAQVTLEPGTDAAVNGMPARVVAGSVVPSEKGDCVPQHGLVVALAFRSPSDASKSGVAVAYADEGAATRDDLLRIVRSYRFVPQADRSMTTPPPTTYR